MSTQKAKFELYRRLQELGFGYEEATSLRRIEMALKRWAERECGDGSNWAVERDEKTGKPFNVYHGPGAARSYPIVDREAGALRRLKKIVWARNDREAAHATGREVLAYHQGDPRGCMLYLVRSGDLPEVSDESMVKCSGPAVIKDGASRLRWLLSCFYTRGLAICC
jgi:hypothetical protein